MANHCKLLLIVTRYRVLNITILGCKRLITILPVRATKKRVQFPSPLAISQTKNTSQVLVNHIFLFDRQWKVIMHITLFKVPEVKPQNDSFRITNLHFHVYWILAFGSFLTTYDLLLTTI